MEADKETYNQAIERIYSREGGEGVGVKEQILNDVEHGHYDGEDYNERWAKLGISKEEFNAAQAKAHFKRKANSLHNTLTGGKP